MLDLERSDKVIVIETPPAALVVKTPSLVTAQLERTNIREQISAIGDGVLLYDRDKRHDHELDNSAYLEKIRQTRKLVHQWVVEQGGNCLFTDQTRIRPPEEEVDLHPWSSIVGHPGKKVKVRRNWNFSNIPMARNITAPKHPHLSQEQILRRYGSMIISFAEDLSDWKPLAEGLNYREYLELCLQGMEGCAELHKEGLVHGDIKPWNVLVKDNHAVLTDLESTNPIGTNFKDTIFGSEHYNEFLYPFNRLHRNVITDKIDVFSWGITLLGKKAPTDGSTHLNSLIQEKAEFSPELARLIADMTQWHQAMRPTLAAAVASLKDILIKTKPDHNRTATTGIFAGFGKIPSD